VIYTSNYATSGDDPCAVAISRSVPDWFKGPRYAPLAPSHSMLKMKAADFRRSYAAQLDALDAAKVAQEIDGKILLCYEPAGRFCHRRMVSVWLQAHGITSIEIGRARPASDR